jgi:hypothetical protein
MAAVRTRVNVRPANRGANTLLVTVVRHTNSSTTFDVVDKKILKPKLEIALVRCSASTWGNEEARMLERGTERRLLSPRSHVVPRRNTHGRAEPFSYQKARLSTKFRGLPRQDERFLLVQSRKFRFDRAWRNQERGWWMWAKERDRLKVLHEVKKRHITQKQAAGELGLSVRWVRKLLLRLTSCTPL